MRCAYDGRKPFAILYPTFDYLSKRNIQKEGKLYFSGKAIHHFKLGCSHPCHKNVIKCELMLRHIHRRRRRVVLGHTRNRIFSQKHFSARAKYLFVQISKLLMHSIIHTEANLTSFLCIRPNPGTVQKRMHFFENVLL